MKTTDKKLVLGLLLLSAGAFLMLHRFDLLPIVLPRYLFSWKSLLMFLGVFFLITEKNKSTGLILFAIGGSFMAMEIWGLTFREVFSFAIPLVLIIAGLGLLFRPRSFQPKTINETEDASIMDRIHEVNIFGGGEKVIKSDAFRGGQITAIFGGSEIDLRHAELADGVNAIDLTCIFGGVTLLVPDNWIVKNDVTPIFGGFSDSRKVKSLETNPGEKILYVKGVVIFGGGEVK